MKIRRRRELGTKGGVWKARADRSYHTGVAHSAKSLFRHLSEYLKWAYKGLQHSYDFAFVKSSVGNDKTLVLRLDEHQDLLGIL